MPETGIGPRLLRTREETASHQLPFISVIVPARNEERFIGRTLAQLCNQAYDPNRFEVIVADGASTDATRTVVAAFSERHANVYLVANPKRLSSAGRNAAIAASQGDIITIVDGHCDLDNPAHLRELAAAFARSGADCVGRPQPLDVAGATALQRAIAVGRASRLGHHPSSHIYSDREGFVPPQSVATAYRRDVFNLVGLFDERFDACEDVEFNHRLARAGVRCFFTPRVQVHYHPRATLAGLFGQMMRYGRGRVRLLRKHPDSFTVPGFIPALWVCFLVGGLLASVLSPLAATAYLGVLGTYALCVLLFSLGLGIRGRSPVLAGWLPLVYVTIHLGAGLGLLWETVRGYRIRPAAEEKGMPQPPNSAFERASQEAPADRVAA
jgi:succinoglycan biosynthesis protein ExoA